eukprot:m.169847 g.169847  ORF g.169847 m.169847 type:complete len:438 (-) comp14511_c0_seq3:1246-2559(-)
MLKILLSLTSILKRRYNKWPKTTTSVHTKRQHGQENGDETYSTFGHHSKLCLATKCTRMWPRSGRLATLMGVLSIACAVVGDDGVATTLDCAFDEIYPYQYVTYFTDTPPVIDGRLDEPVWEAVPWTRDLMDISGPAFPVPRFRTRSKIRWDDVYLYVGAELEEPDIWATLTEHDTVIFQDNDFEVFVSADGTSHMYKEYEMNALNTSWSLCLNKPYANGGYENSSRVFGKHGWDDPGLRSAVFVNGTLNNVSATNYFWSVEIAFPLSALAYNTTARYPPKEGDYWRINFSRVEWHVTVNGSRFVKVTDRSEDNWVLAPTYIIGIHYPEYWAYLQFANSSVNTTQPVKDPDWTVRFVAMQLYYAQQNFYRINAVYTQDVAQLDAYTPVQGLLARQCTGTISITLSSDPNALFTISVADIVTKRIASVRSDRYLVVNS